MNVAGQRLFFALWPPAALRLALDDLAASAARRADARPSRAETLHLTLVFLGHCAPGQVARLQAGAAQIELPPFVIAFDQLGCWPGNGIVWLAPSSPPPELLALEAALRALAKAQGCRVERRPYVPHLTLARRAQTPFSAQTIAALSWRAERLSLVESMLTPRGPRYRDLASWPLSG